MIILEIKSLRSNENSFHSIKIFISFHMPFDSSKTIASAIDSKK